MPNCKPVIHKRLGPAKGEDGICWIACLDYRYGRAPASRTHKTNFTCKNCLRMRPKRSK